MRVTFVLCNIMVRRSLLFPYQYTSHTNDGYCYYIFVPVGTDSDTDCGISGIGGARLELERVKIACVLLASFLLNSLHGCDPFHYRSSFCQHFLSTTHFKAGAKGHRHPLYATGCIHWWKSWGGHTGKINDARRQLTALILDEVIFMSYTWAYGADLVQSELKGTSTWWRKTNLAADDDINDKNLRVHYLHGLVLLKGVLHTSYQKLASFVLYLKQSTTFWKINYALI